MEEKTTTPRTIKQRNIILVYVFGFITLGLYFIYWYISTKRDLNSLGANIPHSILFFIPLINLYWHYKYAQGYVKVKGKGNTIIWFLLFIIISIITPGIIQTLLNKKTTKTNTEQNNQQTTTTGTTPPTQPPTVQVQTQTTPTMMTTAQ